MTDDVLGQAKKRCLCSGCGRVFSTVGNFDRHQTGVDPVVCHDPATRGLVEKGVVWRAPPRPARPDATANL